MRKGHNSLATKIRRAAKLVGLRARKPRSSILANQGGWQLVSRYTDDIKAGHEFELSDEDASYFIRRWPEESKFELGASQQDYWTRAPKPRKPRQPRVTEVEAVVTSVPLQVPLEAAALPQISSSEADIAVYRSWGFRNGPSDLELVPRPDWLYTFKEVCDQFAFKKPSTVSSLAGRHHYPEGARLKGLITEIGILKLKAKEHARRLQQKAESSKPADKNKPSRQNPPTKNDKFRQKTTNDFRSTFAGHAAVN
jgi:hypothetical protein